MTTHYLAAVVLLIELCITTLHGITVISSSVVTASSIASPDVCVIWTGTNRRDGRCILIDRL